LFYRWRIHEKLSDGDLVCVHLKNRSKKTSEKSYEEEEWYERAFGIK